MATSQIGLLSVMVFGLVMLSSSAPGWAQDPYPDLAAKKRQPQNLRSLNPQPEVPSRPSAAAPKGASSALKVAPNPAEAANPKALNPQPEVPSKPKKKNVSKKAVAPSKPQ